MLKKKYIINSFLSLLSANIEKEAQIDIMHLALTKFTISKVLGITNLGNRAKATRGFLSNETFLIQLVYKNNFSNNKTIATVKRGNVSGRYFYACFQTFVSDIFNKKPLDTQKRIDSILGRPLNYKESKQDRK